MKYLFSILFILYFVPSIAQNSKGNINVYVNCDFCDMSFVRNEFKWVNYVRDMSDANVIILGMSQLTGSGGEQYRLIIEGKKEFSGINDTLIFESQQDDTENEIRQLYLKYIKLGLFPFIIKTPLVKHVEILFPEQKEINTELPADPWHGWVCSFGSSGWFSGEQSNRSFNTNTHLTVKKIAEKWKFIYSLNYHYSNNKFSYDEYEYTYVNRSFNSGVKSVISISDHWSFGIFQNAGASTFNNYDFYMSLNPAIEWNFFPYKRSFEKELRFSYNVGANFYDYIDTTIFFKTKETRLSQNFSVKFSIIKKWGNVGTSIYFKQFLHNLSFYSLSTYIDFSIRIVKGLSIYSYIGYSMIRNQINLSKNEVTQEELLLRQRQMKTNFSYWGNIGISYTFGSRYNNIVNPRFDED